MANRPKQQGQDLMLGQGRQEKGGIRKHIADWIRSTLQAKADDPIALDGKTARGAKTDAENAPQFLSFRTHESQEMLLQVAISKKTNEIPVAQALLPCLPVEGRVFTADALHTQKDFMLVVEALGGKTVLTVKKNQPTLYADLATSFADPYAQFQQFSTIDRHRGASKHVPFV